MMFAGAAGATLLLTPADSARAVVAVYTVSLLATLPLMLAAVVLFLFRRASAEARSLVWRSALVALLVIFVGGRLPLHWVAWAVPSALAVPLVALGRVQVTSASVAAVSTSADALYGASTVRAVLWIYAAGLCLVLVPTILWMVRARLRLRRAMRVHGGRWERAVDEVRAIQGVTRPVRLFVDVTVSVPMTWGFVRPVVVLPRAATSWSNDQLRIVLMHELGHVRAHDWIFSLAARLVCAIYWFHPGVWWVARGLRQDCELACDDRVIASGVRRSDYAELLVSAAAALRPTAITSSALALSHHRGIRARIAAVLDARHDVRPLPRGWAAAAAIITLSVAGPISAIQLAPSRDVLTTLMLDTRWESRAYAVLGLAQRTDSIAVAQSAAERDPNPRVRAWARYALDQASLDRQRGELSELRAILRD
jgi:beta-lactamase regulating signal transducer with metallopeptidase domain